MRTLKWITTSLVVLAMLFYISCEKNQDLNSLQEISFNINNATDAPKKGGDDIKPECSDLDPSYALVTINNEEYRLNILNDGTETSVIKIKPGIYTLNSFEVYSVEDSLIWVSPTKDSYYGQLWNLNGVEITIEVKPFKKLKVNIDVLCWTREKWEEFGFGWIGFNKIIVRTICFSGDWFAELCKFLPRYYHTLEGSPYVSQTYHGDIFPAIYKVLIKNEDGEVVNNLSKSTNLEYSDTKKTLCIHYPDYINKDEKYTFEIYLAMHDNTWPLLYESQPFSADDALSVTGSDGVFYFGLGNSTDMRVDKMFDLPFCPDVQFESKNIVIKNIFFFGDICTANYKEWGQPQYDFIADMRVTILDNSPDIEERKVINVTYSSDLETGGPLKVEYPDYKNRDDEEYKVNIHIKDLSGNWKYVTSIKLDPNKNASEFYGDDVNGIPDKDGVYDFVFYEVNNCNYGDNKGVNLIKEMIFD